MNDDHITRLESEIRYLKGLLDENGIPYDYEAFVEAAKREEPVEIEFPELTAEHAILFYSYFRGRKDVYVKRNAILNDVRHKCDVLIRLSILKY